MTFQATTYDKLYRAGLDADRHISVLYRDMYRDHLVSSTGRLWRAWLAGVVSRKEVVERLADLAVLPKECGPFPIDVWADVLETRARRA